MVDRMALEFLSLSIYVLFTGFTFCDGFKLYTGRKILWAVVFLLMAVSSLKLYNEFDLTFILPLPTTLALLLCLNAKIKNDKKNNNP